MSDDLLVAVAAIGGVGSGAEISGALLGCCAATDDGEPVADDNNATDADEPAARDEGTREDDGTDSRGQDAARSGEHGPLAIDSDDGETGFYGQESVRRSKHGPLAI